MLLRITAPLLCDDAARDAVSTVSARAIAISGSSGRSSGRRAGYATALHGLASAEEVKF